MSRITDDGNIAFIDERDREWCEAHAKKWMDDTATCKFHYDFDGDIVTNCAHLIDMMSHESADFPPECPFCHRPMEYAPSLNECY